MMTNTTYDINKNIRQWTYQYCTEFGWFQEPNTLFPTRSQSLNADFWIDYCQRIYSPSIAPPAIAFSNSYFGGLEITGKNIYFLTASEDPWQFAGMTSIYDPSKQSEMKAWHIECVDCGHCVDLHEANNSDPENLVEARTDVWNTIVQWLKEDAQERGLLVKYDQFD